ncbi:hypothetical protein FNYG_13752 [Fusarium nygamai]|uniref:Cytochrome P450 n=1 Tax=Gibberella nygamai TaxID=42673 RepID=A0A2K0UUN4_GIBNY|nr:hypothetical protein FNYG_13752 [Fusarium nygamai]
MFEPSFRDAVRIKRGLCRREIAKAAMQLETHADGDTRVRSAVELMVRRENLTAAEEGREPQYYSDSMIDEPNLMPYLDAVIEGTVRLSGACEIITRIATTDTQVLGRPIPKGTEIWMLAQGPSMVEPAFDIDESLHSEAWQKAWARGKVRT